MSSLSPYSPLSLVLHEDTLRQHPNGAITGIVFWRINQNAFPDEPWNDFVIVVLGWWTCAIIRLLSGNSDEETMHLMDGPYCLICKGSAESVSCRFVDRREGGVVTAAWAGNTSDLAVQILTAGKAALLKCHHNSWVGSDIALLEREVHSLHKMV